MKVIKYPVNIKDISKFESQNDGIAINVFALEKSNDIITLYSVYIYLNIYRSNLSACVLEALSEYCMEVVSFEGC